MNRAQFKPAVDGPRAHLTQRCGFIRRDHAARLGAPVATLLRRDEWPVNDDHLALLNWCLKTLECSFHARLLIVFLLPDARSRPYNQRARPVFGKSRASRLALKVSE